MEPENKVYKLIGPTLVPQETEEAKLNVAKRLEFIQKELDKVELKIKDLTEKSEVVRSKVCRVIYLGQ